MNRQHFYLLLAVMGVSLCSCSFDADNRPRNTIDITVKLGPAVMHHGYGYFLGIVAAGSTTGYTFTIENIGYRGDLALTGGPAVDITGDGFTVTAQPASLSLAPGERTGFTVQFSGSVDGTYDGIVTIPNNDTGESDYTFGLTAIVASP